MNSGGLSKSTFSSELPQRHACKNKCLPIRNTREKSSPPTGAPHRPFPLSLPLILFAPHFSRVPLVWDMPHAGYVLTKSKDSKSPSFPPTLHH